MRTDEEVKALCDFVRQTSYEIRAYHGHGHLEKVYENALGRVFNGCGETFLQKRLALWEL
jgi:hypothetical protein